MTSVPESVPAKVNSVSIIIPIWNGMRDLPRCLAALEREIEGATLPVETLLIDNASEDGSGDYVAANFAQMTLLRQERNLGFVGGCNAGLRRASGDLLILLNQDTEVRAGWLAALTAVFDDDSIGIAGSKALYPDGTIQHAGARLDTQGIAHHLGSGEVDRDRGQAIVDVDYVSGASLAICRRAYSVVGDLDEGFAPAYYEDVDWCARTRKAGFRVVYAPGSVLVHHERSTADGISDETLFLVNRNRLRFVFKHWPLERLTGEFLPGERAWLETVASTRLVTAMQHAYLYQLMHLGEVMAAREAMLGECQDEVDALAAILLALRGVYPLVAANVGLDSMAGDGEDATHLSDRMTRFFARLTNQKRLAEVMIAYLAQSNREIGEMALELHRLQRRIDELERGRDGGS